MRYLGSKESLTEPIIQLLADKNLLWKELVFFDAFCGMGAVSDAIKTSYDHIVLNDSLKCSLTFALGKILILHTLRSNTEPSIICWKLLTMSVLIRVWPTSHQHHFTATKRRK